MSTKTTSGRHRSPASRLRRWFKSPLQRTAGSAFARELLSSPGLPGTGRLNLTGPLSDGFMLQRGHVESVISARPMPLAEVDAARIEAYEPTSKRPALQVKDPVRIADGVRIYGGRTGLVALFDCAAILSIGVMFPDGALAYFAPDELDRAPIADTLVMPAVSDEPGPAGLEQAQEDGPDRTPAELEAYAGECATGGQPLMPWERELLDMPVDADDVELMGGAR